jgi:hypothetical protein
LAGGIFVQRNWRQSDLIEQCNHSRWLVSLRAKIVSNFDSLIKTFIRAGLPDFS